jgi:DNA polymerase
MCDVGSKMHQEGIRTFDPHVFSTMTNSPYMIIGQNPGLNECVVGEPFVGSAGKTFDEELEKNDLNRGVFYITNAMKCHTPENRVPTDSELKTCSHFLFMEIRILRPIFVIALGAVAFKVLCPDMQFSDSLGTLVRSTIYDVSVFPIYHPSPRNLSDEHRRQAFIRDVKTICELIKRVEVRLKAQVHNQGET